MEEWLLLENLITQPKQVNVALKDTRNDLYAPTYNSDWRNRLNFSWKQGFHLGEPIVNSAHPPN